MASVATAAVIGEGVGWGLFGAVAGELARHATELGKKVLDFPDELQRRDTTLGLMSDRSGDIVKLSGDLNDPPEDMERLTAHLEKGKDMVEKFKKEDNFLKRLSHSGQLSQFDSHLNEHVSLVQPLDQFKETKKIRLDIKELKEIVQTNLGDLQQTTGGIKADLTRVVTDLDKNKEDLISIKDTSEEMRKNLGDLQHTTGDMKADLTRVVTELDKHKEDLISIKDTNEAVLREIRHHHMNSIDLPEAPLGCKIDPPNFQYDDGIWSWVWKEWFNKERRWLESYHWSIEGGHIFCDCNFTGRKIYKTKEELLHHHIVRGSIMKYTAAEELRRHHIVGGNILNDIPDHFADYKKYKMKEELLRHHIVGGNILNDIADHFADYKKYKIVSPAENQTALDNVEVTQKSSAYSYGVFLLEMLTGQNPVLHDLPSHVRSLIKEGKTCDVFDVHLLQAETRDKDLPEMQKVLEIAMMCVAKNSNQRPNMADVAKMMKSIRS